MKCSPVSSVSVTSANCKTGRYSLAVCPRWQRRMMFQRSAILLAGLLCVACDPVMEVAPGECVNALTAQWSRVTAFTD